jgi:hypothetical protein
MAGAPRDAIAVACALIALTLGDAPAHADPRQDEQCTREDAQSAAAPETDGIGAEAVHALPAVTVDAHPLPSPQRRGIWPPSFVEHFVDHFDLATRLRAIKRLKILPVFDNARLTIFFGVDRRGLAGLHIQQQDTADLPPLLAHEAPFADVPPMRAVPLRSP